MTPALGSSASTPPDGTDPSRAAAQVVPSASSSADCESSSIEAGSWPVDLGDADPLDGVSVRADARCNVLVASARTGVRKLDVRGATRWVRPFGSIIDVTLDGAVYAAGSFSGELVVDATTLTSSGGSDAYIVRIDDTGKATSAVALGGSGDESAASIAAAPDGGVVVSGPGLGTVKLDRGLRQIWQVPLTGAVAVDADGAVLVTGALVGSATFGTTTLTSAGGEDVLVAKLSSDGAYEWASRYGDAGAAQHGEAIAVDGSGNVVITGVADGTVDFGGDPVTVPPGSCPEEVWCKQAAFVVKLDRDGGFVWSRSRAPVRFTEAVGIDEAGNVVVSGSYPGNVPPYRTPLLMGFGADGEARRLAAPDAAAVGHGVAVDRARHVFFAETTESGELGRATLLRVTPN